MSTFDSKQSRASHGLAASYILYLKSLGSIAISVVYQSRNIVEENATNTTYIFLFQSWKQILIFTLMLLYRTHLSRSAIEFPKLGRSHATKGKKIICESECFKAETHVTHSIFIYCCYKHTLNWMDNLNRLWN